MHEGRAVVGYTESSRNKRMGMQGLSFKFNLLIPKIHILLILLKIKLLQIRLKFILPDISSSGTVTEISTVSTVLNESVSTCTFYMCLGE